MVKDVRCGEEPLLPQACPESFQDPAHAVRLLSSCTDAAVKYLVGVARLDPKVNGDLAAAYYVRAQRNDTPEDLLRAYDAVELANPDFPMTRFNRALILEALGLTEDAVEEWTAYLAREPDSRWAAEAERNRANLERIRFSSDWRRKLEEALSARDRVAVGRIVAPVLDSAEGYLEDVLLRRWADAPSPESLGQAALLADEISERINDRYPKDVVNAINQNSSDELREGFRLVSKRDEKDGLESLKKAVLFLEDSRNPLRYLARLYLFTKTTEKDIHKRDAELKSLEEEVRQAGYKHVEARVRSVRGYLADTNSRYVDALNAYDSSLHWYTAVGDYESIATIHIRKLGMFQILGQYQHAWREALRARKYEGNIAKSRNAGLLAGEAASTAMALGHPAVALLYHDADVRRQRQAVEVAAGSERERELIFLVIALRGLAEKKAQVGSYGSAQTDMDEANSLLASSKCDDDTRREIRSRLVAIEGEVLLHKDPAQAVSRFSEALRLAGPREIATIRVSFLIRRAEANFLARRPRESEDDLRTALTILRGEENGILASRQLGDGEEIWTPYFRRFERAYHRLIADLLARGEVAEAFRYAETARAFEPINLIKQHKNVAFRDVADIVGVQSRLPLDTVMLQYVVTDERTYTWIISPNRFKLLELPVTRARVEQWRTELELAVTEADERAVNGVLSAIYDGLAKSPITEVAKGRRVVIVPSAGMDGLPFRALRNPDGGRYLMEDYVISTAGSASLYLWSLDRDRQLSQSAERPSLLLIGDPAFDQDLLPQHYARLRGADAEVKAIAEQYGAAAKPLTGKEATAQRFREMAPQYTIVHVAAHAIANTAAPSQSMILLAPAADGSDSGALRAIDLLKESKQLSKTRLVVLSACSSATGSKIGPEGVAPLVRPFIGQGVPAVIGTLWDVNDATTKELMVSFYRHYRPGTDMAVALTLAQRELLDDNQHPDHRSVLAWGGFQAIGYAGPPSPE